MFTGWCHRYPSQTKDSFHTSGRHGLPSPAQPQSAPVSKLKIESSTPVPTVAVTLTAPVNFPALSKVFSFNQQKVSTVSVNKVLKRRNGIFTDTS